MNETDGGWVNDSEPEAEFQEPVDKSKAVHPLQYLTTEDGCSKPCRWQEHMGEIHKVWKLYRSCLTKSAAALNES